MSLRKGAEGRETYEKWSAKRTAVSKPSKRRYENNEERGGDSKGRVGKGKRAVAFILSMSVGTESIPG